MEEFTLRNIDHHNTVLTKSLVLTTLSIKVLHWKLIKQLDLSFSKYLDDEGFLLLLKGNFPHLTQLRLNGCSMLTVKGAVDLMSETKLQNNLQDLQIKFIEFTSKEVRQLQEAADR